MSLSQVPGSPTFRTAAVNAVAVIPLLSSDRTGHDDPTTHSSKSFNEFLEALDRYQRQQQQQPPPQPGGAATTAASASGGSGCIVVPNSNLTRPGDWKYDNTPLRNFHWGHGCQRLQFFDGRPYNSRQAHDRLVNHQVTRSWIDLVPSRRTAALIGVLNVRDCPDVPTLQRALQEWQQWAERYSTPPYEVTAHGRDFERDFVVQRLFVFDSFHESNRVDVAQASSPSLLGASSLVAFPPTDRDSLQMMDVHMNVVINDLAVAIFRELEARIRESDEVMHSDGQPLLTSTSTAAAAAASKPRFAFSMPSGLKGGGASKDGKEEEAPRGSAAELSLNNLASVVSPNSTLAPKKETLNKRSVSIQAKLQNVSKGSRIKAQLLTPLDEFWDYSELSPKDAHEMMKREVARREKFAADLSLLAGSPLDAYGRYTKAADLCKTACPDPLWYASALEGCAAAHIAMAEAGGFNVDEYLESSFQLPEDIMACAVVTAADKTNTKQNMPRIVYALCDDALDVTSRHPKLACFHADLLLKLAWYVAEVEDVHLKCQWGLGDGCYGGEAGGDKFRWEMASATQLNFLELKSKEGEDVVASSTLKRCQKWTEFMHRAAGTGALDPVTRADVAVRCASMSLKGLRRTTKPTDRQRTEERVQFKRKAAFFAATAAEALCNLEANGTDERASAMWKQASGMLSTTGNGLLSGKYGWATLRAVALHAIIMQGMRESSEEAAIQLLSLMGEMTPATRSINDLGVLSLEALDAGDDVNRTMDESERSDPYLDTQSYIADARSYVRERAKEVAKDARARSKELFSGQNAPSSLLTVAQSKWVEDDPIRMAVLPMAEFSSEFSAKILALRGVWSTIRIESCSMAQKRLLGQILELRKNSPASSVPETLSAPGNHRQKLPIEITAIAVAESEPNANLERVQTNRPAERKDDAMATFFNPYATKKTEDNATIVPLGEEQYVLITFANKLSIPFEIASCKLEFSACRNDRIKAPAISFTIPGQTKKFPVQFPFIILDRPNGEQRNDGIDSLDIIGVHVTCLSRSISLPLGKSAVAEPDDFDRPIIPSPAWRYPRRKYYSKDSSAASVLKSPRLEIVPPQPSIQISFAASSTPIEEDTIIPAPLADGETFTLPNLCLSNDPGLSGLGKIERLRVTAHGIPGLPEVVLFDLSGEKEVVDSNVANRKRRVTDSSLPLSVLADCVGFDEKSLNATGRQSISSFISLKLSAASNMGELSSVCNLTLRFRYRGAPASSTLEVWRKREVQIRVMRIKGPRMSSLTFRPDLSWDSAYSDLCKAFGRKESNRWHKPTQLQEIDTPSTESTDDRAFVVNRFGQDPGIHVCNSEVVVMISVANETAATIVLSKVDSSPMGFEGSPMDKVHILPGVSAKVPLQLPRIERASAICEQVTAMTRMKWESEMPEADLSDAGSTGGPMVPINRRHRAGVLEIPSACLKAIIDENPIFFSRICEAPCSIAVEICGGVDRTDETNAAELGKPIDVSIEMELAKWLPPDLLRRTNLTLEFCCCRQNCASNDDDDEDDRRDYVWIGQIRKALMAEGNASAGPHRARLLFFNEGDYFVSACVSFSRVDTMDVKEVWWAEKAATVRIIRSRQKQ